MSKLIANNLSRLNKLSSSDGVISGDKASGRIELEFKGGSEFLGVTDILPECTIQIEDGGFAIVDFGNGLVETYTKTTSFLWIDKIKYNTNTTIKIKGSKISGLIGNKTYDTPGLTDKILNVFKIISFEFPKDSPENINCSNLFVNKFPNVISVVYGEIPTLDDRISNMDSMFSGNPSITGEIPKLPKNLQSASNAFLNCTGLTGPSKDLIQQFITVNKPYFDLNYEDMVLGCEKCVTSWFSVNCGGDHDVIEYLRYTSSKNSATTFPYIMITLPRGLKDKHYVRSVFKNRERFSSFTNCLYCSRDTMGKGGAVFLQLNGANNRHRIDTNSSQVYITDNSKQDLRPSDFSIFTRNLTEAKMTKFFSTEVEEYKSSITTSSYQMSTKAMTLFASQVAGANVSNQGRLAIAELDIWDDEGYLIRMRSQGENMIDLVSGTVYSSSSGISFTTENVEMRDVDKEDLLFWEKFTEKTLPNSFWTEYDTALQDYKANPTKTEEWTVSFDKETVTFSSNCPYFDTAPTKPLVNFFLTRCSGVYPGYYNGYPGPHQAPKSPFHKDTNQLMYFPNATNIHYVIANNTVCNTFPICPGVKGVNGYAANYKYKGVQHFYFPRVSKLESSFHSGNATEIYVHAPNVTSLYSPFTYSTGIQQYLKKVYLNVGKLTSTTLLNLDYSPIELIIIDADVSSLTNINKMILGKSSLSKSANTKIQIGNELKRYIEFNSVVTAIEFAKDKNNFDQALIVPSLSDGTNMFLNSGLSALNISITLNSLPSYTSGTHTITFTGCPGAEFLETNETFDGVENCPIFVKDRKEELRKAFAKAVKGGWTVELGTAQNAASAVMTLDLDSEPIIPKWYKLVEDEGGEVRNSEGTRFILCEVGSAFSKEGVNIGYTLFNSRQECLETWNLTELTEEELYPEMFKEDIEDIENIENI